MGTDLPNNPTQVCNTRLSQVDKPHIGLQRLTFTWAQTTFAQAGTNPVQACNDSPPHASGSDTGHIHELKSGLISPLSPVLTRVHDQLWGLGGRQCRMRQRSGGATQRTHLSTPL
ncbi:hypothetical protein AAFF_G00068050 [Aldrovandia affinis]|uniref:Uncharacterized protein n=1 Tax=Aldrovandia affinis TaxID=143900 RepID=A0AAD7RZ85_9TELE|nr:hypothetical protein AAFF_G00068050 [Aldrovandia affinis]